VRKCLTKIMTFLFYSFFEDILPKANRNLATLAQFSPDGGTRSAEQILENEGQCAYFGSTQIARCSKTVLIGPMYEITLAPSNTPVRSGKHESCSRVGTIHPPSRIPFLALTKCKPWQASPVPPHAGDTVGFSRPAFLDMKYGMISLAVHIADDTCTFSYLKPCQIRTHSGTSCRSAMLPRWSQ